MLLALLKKEWRELALAGSVACVAYGLLLFALTIAPGLDSESVPSTVPFAGNENFAPLFGMITGALAVVAGFWQTVPELNQGSFLFLLHRPVSRAKLLLGKLLAGCSLVCALGALMILLYAAWAATPGTHASPFFWWMTDIGWLILMFAPTVYLASFLSGLRPGHWFGTRLMPLIAMAPGLAAGGAAVAAGPEYWAATAAALVALDLVLVWLVLSVGRERSYS